MFEIREFEQGVCRCYLEIANLQESSLVAKIERGNCCSNGKVFLKIKGRKEFEREISENVLVLESNRVFGRFKKIIEIGNLNEKIEFINPQRQNPYVYEKEGTYDRKAGMAIIEYKVSQIKKLLKIKL